MTATQKISAAILVQVASGKSIKEAIDAVIGEGTFNQIASDVWEKTNAAR
jgi:hypothetical protein